jgi:hypothetical protein
LRLQVNEAWAEKRTRPTRHTRLHRPLVASLCSCFGSIYAEHDFCVAPCRTAPCDTVRI